MTTPTGGACVQITALAHAYAPGRDTLAGIDLTVEPGELVALVGPSGCGKTTRLRITAGLLTPGYGDVRINGRSPAEARAGLAFVFQEPALLPWRTAAGNVSLPLELAGVAARARAPLIAEHLARVGLTDAADHYPHQLSGGMRMRTSLARALVCAPRLLLLDEPFGAVDEITRQRLGVELGRLRAAGGWTALFVTHSAAEAVFLADRVVVLGGRPGRIVGEVAVELPGPRDARTRSEAAFFGMVNEVVRLLERAGEVARP